MEPMSCPCLAPQIQFVRPTYVNPTPKLVRAVPFIVARADW